MDTPWFYLPGQLSGPTAMLGEASARHAVQVLRMRVGDALCLTNGEGQVHQATIAASSKKDCTVSIHTTTHVQRQVGRKAAIAISPLKNASRFEWFLEKATELGIAAIFPIICHRTVREHFRQERLHNICISAMLQSQQAWMPVLHEPLPFEALISKSSAHQPYYYHHKFVAHCSHLEKHHFARALQPGMHEALMLIGPEGDFTNEEILLAENNGIVAVSLGETRLRTETAGIVAASMLCLLP